MKQVRYPLMLLALLTLILSACSSGSKESDKKETADPAEPAEQQLTIQASNGEVNLDEPAKKVVALEWTYAEDLLAAGVQPVGMADIEGYKNWVSIEEELSDEVTEVGTRQEPNLEEIAALEPDLIIGVSFRHEAILKELEGIAPTILFNPYPEDENSSQYEEMENTFIEIAKAVGQENQAKDVLASLDEKYKEAQDTIEGADLKTKDFILTQAYTGAQAPEIRVFTPNSLASVIFEKVGLKNLYQPDKYEPFGYSTLNVEGLTALESANYFYVVQDQDNIYENQLKDNAVWKNLNFVQEDRMYPLGGDAWLFGGPLSAKTLVDRIQDTIAD